VPRLSILFFYILHRTGAPCGRILYALPGSSVTPHSVQKYATGWSTIAPHLPHRRRSESPQQEQYLSFLYPALPQPPQ